jgi:2-amino-1-hydroxyethylphosphonate dioxygenase (glycine-forming)
MHRSVVERASHFEPSWNRIRGLFARLGGESYGEGVSQLEHALQSGDLARRAGACDAEVLAALLHDLGHFVEDAPRMGAVGAERHEELGASLLAEAGFEGEVVELVSSHVAAKRYLVFRDDHYRARLSEASTESLRRQGGAMNEEEALAFEARPLFAAALRLRSWDDRAKVSGRSVPSLDTYRTLFLDHLARS